MKVLIERLGINGEGVGKGTEGVFLDKICFVPKAIPNEVVDVDVIKDKKAYCETKLRKVITPSNNRIVPPCKYFGKCGGCDIQHINIDTQNAFKQNKVRETIKKISKTDVDVSKTIRVNDFYYRNKMVYPIGSINGQAIVGMFAGKTNKVVSIDECMLSNQILIDVYKESKRYFEKSNFRGYDFKAKKGDIKYLVLRNNEKDVLITIVATKKIDLSGYYALIQKMPLNIGLSLIISDSDDDILSGEYYHVAGIEKLGFEEFGIKYSIDNRGFKQINDDIKSRLYEQVLEEINSDDVVLDCYSGAGLLSAIISRKCKSIIGIEINESASNSAKQLAKSNNIDNIKFITGDVKDYIDECIEELDNNVVVLDPPRSGCEKYILESIAKSNIKKIIYISCNPSTLARDLEILITRFDIKKVIPWDMFPQTKHVETFVVLERKE